MKTREFVFQKASETSKDYIADQESKVMMTDEAKGIFFGQYELDTISTQRRLKDRGILSEKQLRADTHRLLGKDLQKLRLCLNSSGQALEGGIPTDLFEKSAAFDHFFDVLYKDTETRRAIEQHPRYAEFLSDCEPEDDETVEEFSELTARITIEALIDEGMLSDELLEQMLRCNERSFKEVSYEFTQQLSQLRQVFQALARDAIQRGVLPITETVLNSRLQHTPTQLVDAFYSHLEPGILGSFDDGTIEISELLESDQREHAFTHEMFHALSGRTIMQIKSGEEQEAGISESDSWFKHLRIGTRFGTAPPRFRWLNEALTESLTMELLRKESRIYEKERRLLSILETKVPRVLFLPAYFENFDPEKPADQRIPHWNALVKAINEAYGGGFLVRLDKFVQEKGVDEAVKIMEQPDGWKQIQAMYK